MSLKTNRHITNLHEVSIYLLISLAFGTIATGSAAGASMALLIAFPVLAAISWFTHKFDIFTRSHAWLWNAIVLGFLAFSAFEIITIPGADVIRIGIRFILILILVKLFSRHAPRDDLQLYALSILAMAAATAVNLGLSYGIFFGAYVLVGTFSIALFHLRQEIDQMPPTLDSSRMPFVRGYILVLTAISFAIFVSSLAIFLVFPRVGLGFFTIQIRDPVQTTGFSEQVKLGSHGILRSDPTVVLRAEFPDAVPTNFSSWRWRTMTFDTYDGQQWKRSINLQNDESSLRSEDGTFNLAKLHPQSLRMAGQTDVGLNMQIYLEPLGTNLMPVLWPASSIHLTLAENAISWSPKSGSLTADSYGDIRHTFKSQIGITYGLTTYPPPSLQKLLSATAPDDSQEYPDDFSRYLQLPEISTATKSLAKKITANASTPYAKAVAIEQYFAQNFTYTTDLPVVDPNDPLHSFLFDAQAGHCEYFATATVILLRAAGIPARLVNGFLGGTWNDVGGYLTVRQGNAHSWAEVFTPEFGWVPIDATPASESVFSQRAPASKWFDDSYDAIRMQWMKWIIEYNFESQIELVRSASSRFSNTGRMQPDAPQRQNSTKSPALNFALTPYLIGIALSILLGFLAFKLYQFFRNKRSIADLNKLFQKLESIAARHNIKRAPHTGPAEFIDRIATKHPESARDLRFFKDRYLAARFGNTPLTSTELRILKKTLRRIQKIIKKS